jgi:RNA polymerase sigma factor (sigma-70 family)
VELIRAGCDEAFEVVVGRYTGPLKCFVTRVLPDPYAEDVVQQTFVRALEALRGGDAEIFLRPWLYRIAQNAALDVRKARGFSHEQLDEGIDGVERPDQAFERRERLRDVVGAIRALPVRQREALVLRELEGRSYDEIAVHLRVSDGAVRQLLMRARARVRSTASALTPIGLFARLPWQSASESVSPRVLELSGAVATGAVIAKVGVTAIAATSVVAAAGATAGVETRAVPAPSYTHVVSMWDRMAHPATLHADGKVKLQPGAAPPRAQAPAAPSSPGKAPSPIAPPAQAPTAHTSPAALAPDAPATDDGSGPGDAVPLYCGAEGLGQATGPDGLRVLSEECGPGAPADPAPPPEQQAPPDQGTDTPPPSGTTGPSGDSPAPAGSEAQGESTTPSSPPPPAP